METLVERPSVRQLPGAPRRPSHLRYPSAVPGFVARFTQGILIPGRERHIRLVQSLSLTSGTGGAESIAPVGQSPAVAY